MKLLLKQNSKILEFCLGGIVPLLDIGYLVKYLGLSVLLLKKSQYISTPLKYQYMYLYFKFVLKYLY